MDIKQLPVYTITAAVVITLLIIIAYLYYSLYRYKLQAINAGLEDEKIIDEYKNSKSKSIKAVEIASVAFSILLFAVFVLSLYARTSGNYFPIKGVGSVHLVGSGSMSYKNEANGYLEENGLNNQFSTYDLIIIKEKPPQESIKLYDVVVYKKDDKQVVHRIVDITSYNEGTAYILRGDANSADDAYPIGYDDIIGIYSNKKIPMIGIFVLFLQSPLGYIAMALVLLTELAAPHFEKEIEAAAKNRLQIIEQAEKETDIKNA